MGRVYSFDIIHLSTLLNNKCSRHVVKKQEKPRKYSVLGAFLACLGGFEPLAFRVGVAQNGYEKSPKILEKTSNLGKNRFPNESAVP